MTKTTETQKSIFSELGEKRILTLKPKTQQYTCFVYNGIEDVKNLMLFLGKNVSLNFDGTIKIKKYSLKGGEVIFKDNIGNVIKVEKFENIERSYDIINSEEFNKNHIQNTPKQK